MFNPAEIFSSLEEAHHARIAALRELKRAEIHAERLEDTAYRNFRGQKMPIDDAKRSARNEDIVRAAQDALIEAEVQHQKAYGTYQNYVMLAELRRTEESSKRRLGV
jgi:transcriptional regulator of met regulon